MSDMNAGDCDDDFLENSDIPYTVPTDDIHVDIPDVIPHLNSVITEEEIERVVTKLKHGKAPG
jgi:hypothetical protein